MAHMMIAAFQLGFVYSLLPGPILITSSQRVVIGGWRQGFWFILGVTVADLIYIAIIQLGLSSFLLNNEPVKLGLWLLGGGWLLKIGLDAIQVPLHLPIDKINSHTQGFKQTFFDGLCMNLLNPLSIVGWAALGVNFVLLWNPTVLASDAYSLLALFIILSGKLTWKLLMVVFISIVRQQIPSSWLQGLSLFGGVLLIVFGISAWISAVNLFS